MELCNRSHDKHNIKYCQPNTECRSENAAMKLRLTNKRSVSASVAATIWIPVDIKTNVLLKVQVPVAMYCIMDVYE